MLPGITLRTLKNIYDERGSFVELMRTDWTELFGEDRISQANLSQTYPGIIRAWHRHLRGQIDYFIALQGSIKICAFNDESKELNEIVSNGKSPQIVRIPGQYWHGFKAIGNQKAMLLYFTTKLYDSSSPDEDRRPWDDPTLIPQKINDRIDDFRINQPWDWNYPPNK